MLRLGLLLVTTYCFSECSARMAVTLLERDYNKMRPNEILVGNIKVFLDRVSALQVTVHPRLRHLFDLLNKEVLQSAAGPGAHHIHVMDFDKTLRPAYDTNKLNRIFTTKAIEKKK